MLDGGSTLAIDQITVVNNDGPKITDLPSSWNKSAEVFLDAGITQLDIYINRNLIVPSGNHYLEVYYFQNPPYGLFQLLIQTSPNQLPSKIPDNLLSLTYPCKTCHLSSFDQFM